MDPETSRAGASLHRITQRAVHGQAAPESFEMQDFDFGLTDVETNPEDDFNHWRDSRANNGFDRLMGGAASNQTAQGTNHQGSSDEEPGGVRVMRYGHVAEDDSSIEDYSEIIESYDAGSDDQEPNPEDVTPVVTRVRQTGQPLVDNGSALLADDETAPIIPPAPAVVRENRPTGAPPVEGGDLRAAEEGRVRLASGGHWNMTSAADIPMGDLHPDSDTMKAYHDLVKRYADEFPEQDKKIYQNRTPVELAVIPPFLDETIQAQWDPIETKKKTWSEHVPIVAWKGDVEVPNESGTTTVKGTQYGIPLHLPGGETRYTRIIPDWNNKDTGRIAGPGGEFTQTVTYDHARLQWTTASDFIKHNALARHILEKQIEERLGALSQATQDSDDLMRDIDKLRVEALSQIDMFLQGQATHASMQAALNAKLKEIGAIDTSKRTRHHARQRQYVLWAAGGVLTMIVGAVGTTMTVLSRKGMI